MNSGNLPYQRCLIPNIPEDVQHTLRDVTNFFLIPLDILLASMSFISNFLVVTAVMRTRSLQHPSLLLLCSLSVTDLLWAMFAIVKNSVRFTHDGFCPEKLGGIFKGFQMLCFMSTLSNLAIISRDRHHAVNKPWWYRNHMTRSRVVKQASVIWLFSVIFAGLVCAAEYFPVFSLPSRVLGSSIYVICIVVMVFSYVGIFVAGRRQRKSLQQQGNRMLATLKREKKLANTVGLILIVLCCTFLPALLAPLVMINLHFSPSHFTSFGPFYKVLLTLNGLVNPLLNFGRNKDIRKAVHGLIGCPHRAGRVLPRIAEGQENHSNILQDMATEIPLEQC